MQFIIDNILMQLHYIINDECNNHNQIIEASLLKLYQAQQKFLVTHSKQASFIDNLAETFLYFSLATLSASHASFLKLREQY